MDLNALADFVAVADGGGISVAARARNQPKQTVSRRLLRLEESLGVRLFDRTTRALQLTDEGRLLRQRVDRALSDLESVQRELADRADAPRGVVRLSAPLLMGHTLLGRVLAALALNHPLVRVEVSLTDRRVDLVEEGFDAAIRVGELADSSLVARLLGRGDTVLVAAPGLLARSGVPQKPEDLPQFPCLLFGRRRERATWSLQSGDQRMAVDVTGPLCADSLLLCHDAAVAGAGIAAIPTFVARSALKDGRLVRVLPGWSSGTRPINLVYPSRKQAPPRLRAFIDTVVACFEQIEL